MASGNNLIRGMRIASGRLILRSWMQCPLCENRTGINPDGTLRKHRWPPRPVPGMSWDYPMRSGPTCKMSNR